MRRSTFRSENFDIYAGARLESYTTKLTRDRSDAPELILMTTKTHHDLNLLPSVNVTYRIDDRHQLRAAYGRSLNRPELRELSPVRSITISTSSAR